MTTIYLQADNGSGGTGSGAAAESSAAPGNAGAAQQNGSLFRAGETNGSSQHHAPEGGATASPLGGGARSWHWASEDGKLADGWLDKLPDDLRGEPSLRSIGTLPDLAKSYVATKKLIGTKLEMPGESATPEQIANWKRIVGAPEKPEGYLGEAQTLRPEHVPADLWDAEGEKAFLAIAHKHHLPPAAVRELAAFDAKRMEAALGRSQEQEQATLSAEAGKLRQAWGAEYQPRLNRAAGMAATLGLKTDDPIFTNSRVVMAFEKMARLISEDQLVRGDLAGAMGGSIGDRIRDIQDPAGTSHMARAYRGDLGEHAQREAQAQLHQLLSAQHAS